MQIIIQNNAVIGTAADDHIATGNQVLVSVPDDFDLTSYIYLGNDLATAQINLMAALIVQQNIVQNSGVNFTFAPAIPAVLSEDGSTVITPEVLAVVGTIQTRNAQQYSDLSFLNGLVSTAIILEQFGITEPILEFRDGENVNHMVTPTMMIQMGLIAGTFVSSTLSTKWRKQVEIQALTTFEQASSYDITIGWS